MSISHQFGIRQYEKAIGGPSTFGNFDGIVIIINYYYFISIHGIIQLNSMLKQILISTLWE